MNRTELIKAIAEEIAEEMLEHIEKLEPLTNGEVIKALFPNETMFEQTETCTYYGNMRFDTDWWNAPYKAESEVKPNERNSKTHYRDTKKRL